MTREHRDRPRPVRPADDPPPEALRRRHSMVLSVLAVMVFVAVVPIVLMGVKISGKMAQDLSLAQREQQLSRGNALANELREHVEGQFGRLEVIADAVATQLESDAESAGTELRLRQLLQKYLGADDALLLQVARPEGAEAGRSVVRVNTPRFDLDAAMAELGPVLEEAVAKGRRGIRFLSNPLRPQPASQPLAVFSVPVTGLSGTSGESVPVLTSVVTMAPIQRAVQAKGDTQLGYTVFVLDSHLTPFAHTRYMRVVERADMSDNPLVKAFGRMEPSAQSLPFTLRESGQEKEMIGTYVPVTFDNHRWGVFLQVGRDIGLETVVEMRKTFVVWGLIALACAVVIGIVFALRITGPIHALTESTRRVASGEFGRSVKVRSNNEIGMLADNFNTMSEEIRKTIDGLHRQRELNEQLFISSIRSLAAAIDARDPYTRGHSERVTRYARIIARQMKLPAGQVRNIEIGALLHDVGKIGIEDRILRKPSALTPEEFEIMKTHPEKGGDIMEPINFLREAAEIIVHHHERWDGSGYPSGLTQEEIPLGARVVAVADTFDAMTTNRPYQRAMTFAVAAKKIGEFSGKACDPGVVKAFQEAMNEGLFEVPERKTQVG